MKDKLTHAESVMLLAECQDIMVEQETSIAALKAEIDALNKIILEQQSKIKHYDEWLSDGVYFTNEEYRKEVATLKSALMKEKIYTLEEAAAALDAFGKRLELDLDVANYLDCEAELRRMADELRGEKE